jgi:hypothetical protein
MIFGHFKLISAFSGIIERDEEAELKRNLNFIDCYHAESINAGAILV